LAKVDAALVKNIVILISGVGSNMAAIVQSAETDQWEKSL